MYVHFIGWINETISPKCVYTSFFEKTFEVKVPLFEVCNDEKNFFSRLFFYEIVRLSVFYF